MIDFSSLLPPVMAAHRVLGSRSVPVPKAIRQAKHLRERLQYNFAKAIEELLEDVNNFEHFNQGRVEKCVEDQRKDLVDDFFTQIEEMLEGGKMCADCIKIIKHELKKCRFKNLRSMLLDVARIRLPDLEMEPKT